MQIVFTLFNSNLSVIIVKGNVSLFLGPDSSQ